MSAAEAEGTALAPRARVHGGIRRRDKARLAEYDRLRSLGRNELESWREVASGPIGFLNFRRDAEDAIVRKHYLWFIARMDAARIESGRRELVGTIPDAVNSIGDIIRGDFGEGKVVVKGRGENAVKEVVIDAAAAGVRSQNARWLLERTGVVAPASAGGNAVQVNVANVYTSRAPS